MSKKRGIIKSLKDSETKKVYEKYKHLDYLFSDAMWMGEDILMNILRDIWQAVKKENEDD